MAILHLIRHGQASFGAADYDALSERGQQQCFLLGQWWAARERAFDQAVTGPMRRHRQSLEAFAQGGGFQADALQVPELAEFDHENVLEVYRPEFADKALMMKTLLAAPSPRRAFQEVFTAAVARWHEPCHAGDYRECWADFRERVLAGFSVLREQPGETLVFTSGGVISVMLQAVLGLDDPRCFALNAVTLNSSVSRVLHKGGELSLAQFNNTAHLDIHNDASLLTFA